MAPDGARAASVFQVLPSQRSASGSVGVFTLARTLPTAMQFDGVTHETPTSALAIAPFFTGPFVTVQRWPFHRSISGKTSPLVLTKLPTAMHVVTVRTVRHDTPSRKLWFVPPGFAIDAIAHLPVAAPALAVHTMSAARTREPSARARRANWDRERNAGSLPRGCVDIPPLCRARA